MSGLERLNSKLAKLKGNDEAAEQTVAGGTDGILAVLLSEIEETILPREMVLSNEAGEEFKLLVAGRRLLRVSGPEIPQDKAQECPAILAAFNGPLRQFLDRAQEIGIAALRPSYRIDAAQMGCSAEMLSGSIATDTPASVSDDPVGALFAIAVAGVRFPPGGDPEMLGDPGLAARLTAFSDVAAPALDRISGPAGGAPVCTILRADAPTAHLLIRLVRQEEIAVLLLPRDALGMLVPLCSPTPA